MTGDIFIFVDFVPKNKGYVTYRDNNTGETLGKGSVEWVWDESYGGVKLLPWTSNQAT